MNVLMPDHLITIAYMDGPFINFVVEKIKSLIFFHLTMPSESTEDMRQWDIVVEQWIEGILSDASWSNQQLSSLYWSRVETAYFIDLILSLRCRANSEFRLHTMHCVVFWFCHVLNGYEHVSQIYKDYKGNLTSDLLLLRDNTLEVSDLRHHVRWVQLARFLNASKVRAPDLPISFSTHQAIWKMVAGAYRYNAFYDATSENEQVSVTTNMQIHFANFYHDTYTKLPLDERKRLDAHRLVQPGFYTTFGVVIQEALGPRPCFLHVLQSLPLDPLGMEMDYILTNNQLYYVDYTDREIQPVLVHDLSILKQGIRGLKKFGTQAYSPDYKIFLSDSLTTRLITENGGHSRQIISQACMNNVLKNLLPLLIEYDPYTRFPEDIEALNDSADYFSYKKDEPNNLWGSENPLLIERLRHHSSKKAYREYFSRDVLSAKEYITRLVSLLVSYPFLNKEVTASLNGLVDSNRCPRSASRLISWIGSLLQTKCDPRFIVAHLETKKLKLLKNEVDATEVQLDNWDSLVLIVSLGSSHSVEYTRRVAAKNDTASFFDSLVKHGPEMLCKSMPSKIGAAKFRAIESRVSSLVNQSTSSYSVNMSRPSSPPQAIAFRDVDQVLVKKSVPSTRSNSFFVAESPYSVVGYAALSGQVSLNHT